ncbi:MAG: nitrogen fixation protein NifH [Chloroflexi bacterium]|nr:nitrogen fixation protein NifH [Chloroflexota bacterium]
MDWLEQLNGNSLNWLLESSSPGVRYLALRDLLDLPEDDAELQAARRAAHTQGPIAEILAQMQPEGFWEKPGPGYLPKYRSTVWSIITLAQLGAEALEDERIARACAYLLDHALTSKGQFSMSGAPSSTIDCLQGNLLWALAELDYADHRLEAAYDWMARSQTGEGIAPLEEKAAPVRYYAGKCGPGFACGANNQLPCAWGATKVMLAFGKLPKESWTPHITRAVDAGIDFLLGVDPLTADYPTGYNAKPNQSWWKFAFPVFYVTDVLQIAEALAGLGYAGDARLANLLAYVRQKQDAQGRWLLEYDLTGKTWVDFGAMKQHNKWVTLRALRVLKAAA